MGKPWSDVLEEAIGAMTFGDALRAKDLFEQLEKAAGSYVADQAKSLSSAWEPFVDLLGRRGFFVRHLKETRSSLEEILAIGSGFDLYDLAVSLSKCDIALAAHLKVPSARAFPELRKFSSDPEEGSLPKPNS